MVVRILWHIVTVRIVRVISSWSAPSVYAPLKARRCRQGSVVCCAADSYHEHHIPWERQIIMQSIAMAYITPNWEFCVCVRVCVGSKFSHFLRHFTEPCNFCNSCCSTVVAESQRKCTRQWRLGALQCSHFVSWSAEVGFVMVRLHPSGWLIWPSEIANMGAWRWIVLASGDHQSTNQNGALLDYGAILLGLSYAMKSGKWNLRCGLGRADVPPGPKIANPSTTSSIPKDLISEGIRDALPCRSHLRKWPHCYGQFHLCKCLMIWEHDQQWSISPNNQISTMHCFCFKFPKGPVSIQLPVSEGTGNHVLNWPTSWTSLTLVITAFLFVNQHTRINAQTSSLSSSRPLKTVAEIQRHVRDMLFKVQRIWGYRTLINILSILL